MGIFDFISKLTPDVKKTNIEDDIRYTKKIMDEVAIPVLVDAKTCFTLSKKRSALYEHASDRFYGITKMRKSDLVPDLLLLVRNARSNLDLVEKLAIKTLEESNYSEAMTLQKAQIIRACGAIGSIADLSVKVINTLMKAEEIHHGADQEITEGEKKIFSDEIGKLSSFLSNYGQEAKTFEKLIGNVPDAMVTVKNRAQVESMFAHEADPFSTVEANGFIPHPVLFIREQIANFQISRYEYNKAMKKQFELRVLSLKSQAAGNPNASLEKQIMYYENQAEKHRDKVEAFEAKYGVRHV